MLEKSRINVNARNVSSEDTPPLVIDDNDLWIKYNALLNADSITEILYCVSDAGMFS